MAFRRTNAIKHLSKKPAGEASLYYNARYQDGTYHKVPVWLEDGDLVQPHPTDDLRGPIAAPSVLFHEWPSETVPADVLADVLDEINSTPVGVLL